MSLKSKAKASRLRKKKKLEKQIEQQKLIKNELRIKTMGTGFATRPRTQKDIQQYLDKKMPIYQISRKQEIKHTEDRWTMHYIKPKRRETDLNMIERDQLAKEYYEINIKTRIGQAYNKSGDMCLTESELAAMKAGQLRRRS